MGNLEKILEMGKTSVPLIKHTESICKSAGPHCAVFPRNTSLLSLSAKFERQRSKTFIIYENAKKFSDYLPCFVF